MITTGFFGSTAPSGIIWYTPSILGDITSDTIIIGLSTNLPCTYEVILVDGFEVISSYLVDNELIIQNPKDNIEYRLTVSAKFGILTSTRTFKFTAKRIEPVFVTDSIIQLPSVTNIDYQLLVHEPRPTDIYTIVSGELHSSLTLTEDGRIIGTNPFDNTLSCVDVQIDDGIYKISKRFTVRAASNILEFDVPVDNTIESFGYNKGPILIDDDWLLSRGWDGIHANISVNIGSRYYPKDGTEFEGGGYQNSPTLTIDVKRSCNLTVNISGDINGPWGHKGENYSDLELFHYKQTHSLNGINGGIAVQIKSSCLLINNGSITGGAGGGGAGGCGVTYLGRNDPGYGGMGGAAIDIRSSNVIIENNGLIISGGAGGAGGWGSEIDGDECGTPGTDGSQFGDGGHGGPGSGSNASVGGLGGCTGADGHDGESVNHTPALGGKTGFAIQTEFTYSLSSAGAIIGKIENF